MVKSIIETRDAVRGHIKLKWIKGSSRGHTAIVKLRSRHTRLGCKRMGQAYDPGKCLEGRVCGALCLQTLADQERKVVLRPGRHLGKGNGFQPGVALKNTGLIGPIKSVALHVMAIIAGLAMIF